MCRAFSVSTCLVQFVFRRVTRKEKKKNRKQRVESGWGIRQSRTNANAIKAKIIVIVPLNNAEVDTVTNRQ
jgi:hypothetical protein